MQSGKNKTEFKSKDALALGGAATTGFLANEGLKHSFGGSEALKNSMAKRYGQRLGTVGATALGGVLAYKLMHKKDQNQPVSFSQFE